MSLTTRLSRALRLAEKKLARAQRDEEAAFSWRLGSAQSPAYSAAKKTTTAARGAVARLSRALGKAGGSR